MQLEEIEDQWDDMQIKQDIMDQVHQKLQVNLHLKNMFYDN